MVVQVCTEFKTRVREDSQSMDKQTCPFCNQPVKADQDETASEDGQLAHTECSAKASGESIYIPGNDNVSPPNKPEPHSGPPEK